MASLTLLALLMASSAKPAPAEMGWEPQAAVGLPGVLDPPSPSRCSAVQLADRLPCSSHRLSHGRCSHLGCCFDPQDRVIPCYYGKAVTARCTPEGSFSLAVSRDAVVPPLRLDSLHLLGPRGRPCGPLLRNEAFVVFNFPLSACGTIFKEAGGQQIYENELWAERWTLHTSSGSVTRDSGFFRLTIRCSYSAQEPLPVSVLVATPPPPAAITQRGGLAMDMRVARDETYSSFYGTLDFPVAKLLRDPIHLEVRLLGIRDPALVLLLHECWATPGTSPRRAPQWPLLQNGCPAQGDNYQAQLVPLQWDAGLPFPSHHQRFMVRTFAFVGADSRRMLSGPIYFHCSASTCVPSAQELCATRCEAGLQGRRELVAVEGDPLRGWGEEAVGTALRCSCPSFSSRPERCPGRSSIRGRTGADACFRWASGLLQPPRAGLPPGRFRSACPGGLPAMGGRAVSGGRAGCGAGPGIAGAAAAAPKAWGADAAGPRAPLRLKEK
ncbi:zona pellucida sperm-binding protein 4-like isoform X1 [Crotalus tigris]|uniref:zona pellucida sperm-binding protein 4-like isoform X1 n=1 Tax=Crotalus tigris TaxID=88082 RepID=UPI00192F7589|nr:zona pellucida sperm-binding protein 4-like isoform X1 [Crotalus tigris]